MLAKWTFLAKPSKGGHGFYRLSHDKPPRFDVYIGDDSGNPDCTEGTMGPLRVDYRKPLVARTDGNWACPVIEEGSTETGYVVVLNTREAAWLVKTMRDLKVKWLNDIQALGYSVLLDPARRWNAAIHGPSCEQCFNLGFQIITRKQACLPASPGNHENEAIIVECDNCCHHPESPWGARNHVEAAMKFGEFWFWACDGGFMDDLAKQYREAMAISRGEVQ
jgi:hypothetical protein